MSDLTSLTTPTRLDAQTFALDVPDGWQQGRGAFGGLVLASLVRAIEGCDDGGPSKGPPNPPGHEANGRRLRSLTAEICGPVLAGINTIRVERLRTGTGVSTLAARLARDGEVLAHMVGILGRPRAEGTDLTALPAPVMPPWREVPEVRVERSFGPRFADRLEFRPVGALPFQGGSEAVAAGWIRPRDPGPARDAGYVTAMADAWWPAIFSCFTEPRPIATVAFTLELLDGTAGLDPDAPLFHSARAVASRGGYVVELRELRGEDGRILALNQQTLTIIK
jgi:hypothetical protein